MNKIRTAVKAWKQLQDEVDNTCRCPITISTRAMHTINSYKAVIHELLAEIKRLEEKTNIDDPEKWYFLTK